MDIFQAAAAGDLSSLQQQLTAANVNDRDEVWAGSNACMCGEFDANGTLCVCRCPRRC